jgi:hypothetical protein
MNSKTILGAAVTTLVLILVACRPTPTPTPTPSPTPPPVVNISGVLRTITGEPASGRRVALCRLSGELTNGCELLAESVTADDDGDFAFTELEPASYLAITDSTLGDFDAGLTTWAGEILRPGDWPWLRDQFLALSDTEWIDAPLPEGLPDDALLDRGPYATTTLMLGESPFIIAHTLDEDDGWLEVSPIVINGTAGGDVSAELVATLPYQPDLAAIRDALGALSQQERALFDREMAARWDQFIAGDDTVYREDDARLIEAVRNGRLHEIGAAYFTTVQATDDALLIAPGYVTVDVMSGATEVIGWLDEQSGDVIEASTGYRHNVHAAPGEWLETGPNGEQFYSYGFSYYRRWGQIFPDPFISVLEAFYTIGVQHVEQNLDEYATVTEQLRGDLDRVRWHAGLLDRMAAWQPLAAPFVHLPDSGTVDVRRERFLRAMIDGNVVVDEDSVDAFLESDEARSSAFTNIPTHQEVIDALRTPYRSGHLFTDMEAAIILEATYSGDDPLVIRISDDLEQGFQVPRYGSKEVLVSPSEIADVLLGYPGALNSRWPHEMGHIVDFQSSQYTFRERPAEGSRCEPGKYLMEFMWWVERYPGDAPDWDWMPINSGLTLARLLTEQYHNSGC